MPATTRDRTRRRTRRSTSPADSVRTVRANPQGPREVQPDADEHPVYLLVRRHPLAVCQLLEVR